MSDIPYCCAACRLLQPEAQVCIDCGSVVIARLDTEQELLRWTTLSVYPEDRGVRERRVTSIDLPSPDVAAGAVTRSGTARALGAPLRSLLDDQPILAEQISLITRWRRSVFLRRVHAAPFLVDGAEPVAIAGVLRLIPHTRPPRERIPDDDPRLERLGIPPHFLHGAHLETVTIHPGDSIAVTGVVESGRFPELAMYRDADDTPVMTGRAGSLVRIAV